MYIFTFYLILTGVYSQLLSVSTFASGFSSPIGIVFTNSKYFVAEGGNHRIRVLNANGASLLSIGTGGGDFLDGSYTTAKFNRPQGLAVSNDGSTLYVADADNHLIRTINIATYAVGTLAGDGNSGSANGDLLSSRFDQPFGIAIDSSGNIFVSESGNHRIRKITSTSVTTFAGSSSGFSNGQGTNAMFKTPRGMAFGSDGLLYVADRDNHVIRKITTTGFVSTFAGTAPSGIGYSNNLDPLNAKFSGPRDVVFDSKGNLYVADGENNGIRKISTNGAVSTLAGSPTGNYGNQNGLALSTARFSNPIGIIIDDDKNFIVSDNANQILRNITTLVPVISAVTGTPGTAGGGIFTILVQNINVTTGYTAITNGATFTANATSCSCAFQTSYTSVTCTAPSVPYSGSFTVQLWITDNLGESFYLQFNSLNYSPPSISSITPLSGTTAGGTTLTIDGANFGIGANPLTGPVILFGPTPCLSPNRLNHTRITCLSPAVKQ